MKDRSLAFGSLILLLGAVTAPAQERVGLENTRLRVEIGEADASLHLLDKATGVQWEIGSPQAVMKDKRIVAVSPQGGISGNGQTLSYRSQEGSFFQLRLAGDFTVEYSFEPGPEVEEMQPLHAALPLGPGAENYYAAPFRLGILLRPEGTKPYTRKIRGNGGPSGSYSMAMFGAVQHGSALLVTWENPYTDILVEYAASPQARLTMGLSMRKSAKSVLFQPLGKGGYVEIAKAYREVARSRGYLKTLAEKIQEDPAAARFIGAADFKPFVFTRLLPNTRWNPRNEIVLRKGHTFEEAAQLAEHFRKDLGIDRALFVLAGWINGGYDNRHPDILPAAPEIGGNEGLIECSRRIHALGEWLFGLHDNYQDFYRDAPSWNEDYIMKNPDGSLHAGGVWAGGQAFLICSRKSLDLAMRPQNVPRVRDLFHPDLYFCDTVYAAPLYECFDPKHPLTLVDDRREKQHFSAEVRKMIGLFGSEEGKEWAVPYSDYFEGLMSHRTRFGKPPDPEETIIPLFELVYGDAIPLYSHQSDRPRPDNPVYILDHILYAEMPVYYFGEHLYWKDSSMDFRPAKGAEPRLVFARGGKFDLIDQFIKNTYEVLSPLNRATALLPMTDHRFLTADRKVEMTRFGRDIEITVNYGAADYPMKNAVLPQYGFLVESPGFVAFHARRYRDLTYADPPLFALRSLDGRPLDSSSSIRVYHGFGDRRVEWRGKLLEVETERTISRQ